MIGSGTAPAGLTTALASTCSGIARERGAAVGGGCCGTIRPRLSLAAFSGLSVSTVRVPKIAQQFWSSCATAENAAKLAAVPQQPPHCRAGCSNPYSGEVSEPSKPPALPAPAPAAAGSGTPGCCGGDPVAGAPGKAWPRLRYPDAATHGRQWRGNALVPR